MHSTIDEKSILSHFYTHPGQVISLKMLAAALHIPDHLRRELRHVLRQLARQKKLEMITPKKYLLVSDKKAPLPKTSQEGQVKPKREWLSDFKFEIQKILRDAKVEQEFSSQAEIAAKELGTEPSEKDAKGREDLTKTALCTIDGETAKDFDDAVYAEKDGDNFRVIVAIADVSYYVDEGSPLDRDAYARATSIYYPGHCIPMLPEALSNGLCSLKPLVRRLCMVAELVVTPKGAVKSTKLYEGVMKSQARLTYKEVQAFLDGDKTLHEKIPAKVQDSLQLLKEAARGLRKARFQRGAIDFDAVESVVALDDKGEPVSIHPEERLEAHRLIEDLMIAANEAVACYLEKKEKPGIFRIHEMPDIEKLKVFNQLAQSVGALTAADAAKTLADPQPKNLAKLLQKIENHSAKAPLNALLLRSMMQAKYSAENVGHFGLASESYLHFTSPIRRYPDLVVHRLVRAVLTKKKAKSSLEAETSQLQQIAEHCSDRERKATDLERSISALHNAWYMRDKIGEEDDASIVSVTDFGLFVRLKKFHVEGLVHVATLKDGYYDFDPMQMCLFNKSSKKRYALGDIVRIKVINVNVVRRFVDLELVRDPALSTSSKEKSKERPQDRRQDKPKEKFASKALQESPKKQPKANKAKKSPGAKNPEPNAELRKEKRKKKKRA